MKSYLALLALLVLSSFFVLKSLDEARAQDDGATAVACPTVAKLCPDGSSISPTGPKCVMPACPHGGDKQIKPTQNDDSDEDDCNGDDCDDKKTDEKND